MTALEAICPGGTLDLIEPVCKDPIHSLPYQAQMADVVSSYVQMFKQVLNKPVCLTRLYRA